MFFKPQFIYLSLIPAVLLGYEYMQLWYIIYLCCALFIISFCVLPNVFIIINLIPLFFHIKLAGFQINPELTVPILANTIISFFIANRKKNKFDIYPFFLWVGSLALFSSSFYYFIYICFIILILLINLSDTRSLNLKSLLSSLIKNKYQFLFTLIMTLLLFIFFPRFHGFLPSVAPSQKGKIGYSKKISNSTTTKLNLSSQTAFFAEISPMISQENLYWRGRIHQFTDGYNWSHIKTFPFKSNYQFSSEEILQKIKYEQDFEGDLIVLDRPSKILETNLNVIRIRSTNEYRTTFQKKKSQITAISTSNPPFIELTQKELAPYLQLPETISSSLIEFSNKLSASSPKQIISQFKYKIIADKFAYSLSPGNLRTIDQFIEKRIGYCTHYASLLGLILRLKKIPARLVSGFQGGKYNEISGHYEVKSNDAHSWVEYYDENQWKRIDPTYFISPNRIFLGGEEFLNPGFIDSNQETSNSLLKIYYKSYQALQAISYKFGLFIDNYDRNFQMKLAAFFKLNFKNFLMAGIIIIFLILGTYYYFYQRSSIKQKYHPADKVLIQFLKLFKIQIVYRPGLPISLIKEQIISHPKQNELMAFLNIFLETRYGNLNDISILKQKLKSLRHRK